MCADSNNLKQTNAVISIILTVREYNVLLTDGNIHLFRQQYGPHGHENTNFVVRNVR